jgi:hypothetical protein
VLTLCKDTAGDVLPNSSGCCRVAEGLLQQLFPRDAQQTARPQRFKGMIKV